MSATDASWSRRPAVGRRAGARGSPPTGERIAAELGGATGDEVARRLRVHPTRVALIVELTSGPRNVAALAAAMGLDPAAASKHLRELQRASMVLRRQDGTHAVYALVDATVLKVLLMVARTVHADAAPVTAALRVAS
jgi:DNA-binding transcriptional ArsR family regulator